jgi:hypothetical protein
MCNWFSVYLEMGLCVAFCQSQMLHEIKALGHFRVKEELTSQVCRFSVIKDLIHNTQGQVL